MRISPLDSHGGNRWAAEAKWGIKAEQFLDFSANINPLGPSLSALQAIQENLQHLQYYPEPSAGALKKGLAEYLQIDEDNIVLGNGSIELIYLCSRLFYHKRIILLSPCFAEYGRGLENPNIIRVNIDLSNMHLPLKEIAAELQAGDLLFIANPNNPTGNLFERDDLLQLLQLVCERKAMLVLDEAFIDFVGDSTSSLRDLAAKKNVIILGSLTKFFALPGLRIGYALCSRENAQRMEMLLPRWRINALALAAGAAALHDCHYIENTIKLVANEREYIFKELNTIEGFLVYPSQANFVLVDAGGRGITAGQLQAKLGPEGILIRDCSDFHQLSPHHFRLAVRSHSENQIFFMKLRKVLS